MADHQAEVVSYSPACLTIEVDSRNVPELRRDSDRSAAMLVELKLSEDRSGEGVLTHVQATIRPKRSRDRRSTIERARQILSSLKAYLIAREVD